MVAFATLLTAAVYYPPTNLNLATLIVALIANIIGALLPDIDQGSNRLWDLLPGGNTIGKILKNLFLSHRTLSHSLLGIFLVFKATIWLIPKLLNTSFVNSQIVIMALLIGYIAHLASDLMTEEGLPLLFPLKIKFGIPPIKQLRIKTGKWVEKYIVFPGVVLYIIGFGFYNWKIIVEILKHLI